MKDSKKEVDVKLIVPSGAKQRASRQKKKSVGIKASSVGLATKQSRSNRFRTRNSSRAGAIIVDGQDFVAGISLNGNDDPFDLSLDLQINPRVGAFVGTKLALLARCYEKYVFRRIKFHFVSAIPATQTGSYWVAYDKDMADDSPPETSDGIKQMMALAGSRMVNVWENVTIDGDLTDTQDFYYTNYTGYDGRLTNQGQVWLMHDVPGGTNLKVNLWIEYEIELFDPQLEPEDVGLNLTVSAGSQSSSKRMVVETTNNTAPSVDSAPPKIKIMAEPINSGGGTVYEPFRNLKVRGIPSTNYTDKGQPILPPGVYQFAIDILNSQCPIPSAGNWNNSTVQLPSAAAGTTCPIRTYSVATKQENTQAIQTAPQTMSVAMPGLISTGTWGSAMSLYGVASRCVVAVKEASILCWNIRSNTGLWLPCAELSVNIVKLCAHDTYEWYRDNFGSEGTVVLPLTSDAIEDEGIPALPLHSADVVSTSGEYNYSPGLRIR